MANGQQIAKENLVKFEQWISERNSKGDVESYIRGKQLNRSEIATQCGFALSVLRQNPAVKSTLISFEDELRKQGVLPKLGAKQSRSTSASTAKKSKASTPATNKRIKDLEEKNNSLKARVRELEQNQALESLFELHLFETGRAIKP